MKRTRTFYIVMALLLGAISLQAQTKIVLKLDDIGASKGRCKALPIIEYLVKRQLKASYGVIANRLDSTALKLLAPAINAKNYKGEPLVEIWHHGLDHSNNNPPNKSQEFKGTDYQFQKQHFDEADALVKKYLAVQMRFFGAPYNATDSTTIRVVAEHSAYKGLLFSRATYKGARKLTQLNNRVSMENGTGNPDFDFFVEDFNKHPNYAGSYLILQGHPPYWNEAQFAQFVKIVDFLIERKCQFVLPVELTDS